MVEKLEKDGCVLIMCDKNMGMSLFTLDTMREADKALMNQLGAVKIENTKEEIIEDVLAELEKFEIGLSREQMEYLDSKYGDRHSDRRNLVFPFLKSHHKIHKMTEEEIRSKDLSDIKFRPVVDSKQWLTRGYAGLVMQRMREACTALVRSGEPAGQMKVSL